MDEVLFSVRDLVVEFDTRRGTARALDHVSLDVKRQGRSSGSSASPGAGNRPSARR